MNQKEFKQALEKLNITPTPRQLEQLEIYYEELINWNQKTNLTAITNKEEVYLKHFYDSLTLSFVHSLSEVETLCDIGSGAGLPGIVLKIFFPHIKITLIDALGKRVIFLNHMIDVLKLTNIKAVHSRAEEYAKKNRDCFDIVTARAVAKLNVLLELGIPMIKQNGHFIAMKANATDEMNALTPALQSLNCRLDIVKELFLPFENSKRTLIKVKKTSSTPLQYPRNFDKISKKPL